MMLRGWSWDAAIGPAGLGDRPLLAALAAARPDEAGEAAIAATGPRARRRRRLPTHLVVTLVVARGRWAAASMRQGLAAVVAGWRAGAARGQTTGRLPSTAAIVPARPRAGARLRRALFEAVARPIATAQTAGAFLGGLRVMALDGPPIDVADPPEADLVWFDAAGKPFLDILDEGPQLLSLGNGASQRRRVAVHVRAAAGERVEILVEIVDRLAA